MTRGALTTKILSLSLIVMFGGTSILPGVSFAEGEVSLKDKSASTMPEAIEHFGNPADKPAYGEVKQGEEHALKPALTITPTKVKEVEAVEVKKDPQLTLAKKLHNGFKRIVERFKKNRNVKRPVKLRNRQKESLIIKPRSKNRIQITGRLKRTDGKKGMRTVNKMITNVSDLGDLANDLSRLAKDQSGSQQNDLANMLAGLGLGNVMDSVSDEGNDEQKRIKVIKGPPKKREREEVLYDIVDKLPDEGKLMLKRKIDNPSKDKKDQSRDIIFDGGPAEVVWNDDNAPKRPEIDEDAPKQRYGGGNVVVIDKVESPGGFDNNDGQYAGSNIGEDGGVVSQGNLTMGQMQAGLYRWIMQYESDEQFASRLDTAVNQLRAYFRDEFDSKAEGLFRKWLNDSKKEADEIRGSMNTTYFGDEASASNDSSDSSASGYQASAKKRNAADSSNPGGFDNNDGQYAGSNIGEDGGVVSQGNLTMGQMQAGLYRWIMQYESDEQFASRLDTAVNQLRAYFRDEFDSKAEGLFRKWLNDSKKEADEIRGSMNTTYFGDEASASNDSSDSSASGYQASAKKRNAADSSNPGGFDGNRGQYSDSDGYRGVESSSDVADKAPRTVVASNGQTTVTAYDENGVAIVPTNNPIVNIGVELGNTIVDAYNEAIQSEEFAELYAEELAKVQQEQERLRIEQEAAEKLAEQQIQLMTNYMILHTLTQAEIDEMIKEGTLTQHQVDTWERYYDPDKGWTESGLHFIDSLTEEQREAAFEANREHINGLMEAEYKRLEKERLAQQKAQQAALEAQQKLEQERMEAEAERARQEQIAMQQQMEAETTRTEQTLAERGEEHINQEEELGIERGTGETLLEFLNPF